MLAKTKWIYELLEKHFSEEYAQYLYVLSIATYLSKHKELNLIKYGYEGDYLSVLYPDLDMEEGDMRYILRKFEKEKSAIEEFKKELFNMSTGRILIFDTNFGVLLNSKTDKLKHLRVAIIADLDSGCILDYVPSDYHELDYTKRLISALKKRDIEGKTFILNYIYHQKNIQDYIRKKGGKCISFIIRLRKALNHPRPSLRSLSASNGERSNQIMFLSHIKKQKICLQKEHFSELSTPLDYWEW